MARRTRTVTTRPVGRVRSSPEGLAGEPDEVHRVIAQAGTGVEPLVVVVEAAAELREDELAVVVEATSHTSRPLILRVMRDG